MSQSKWWSQHGSTAGSQQHLRRNSKNISPPRVLSLKTVLVLSFLLVMATPPTQPAQPGCSCLRGFLMFSLFHTLFSEENCDFTVQQRRWQPISPHIRHMLYSKSEVAGACVMSKMKNGLLRTSCCRKTQKKISVSSCTFPSLHTCIIQFHIFPFYGSKYSWMIKAQGELAQKLANLWKLASWYILAGVVFVTPLL